jgi:AraC family transcriptional activator of pobA
VSNDQSVTKTISHYGLYGEERDEDPEFIHIEEVRTRSRLYDWNIAAHDHPRMFQLVYIASGGAAVRLDQTHVDIGDKSMVCIPGSVVHAFAFDPDTAGWVLTVSELLLIDARYRRSRKLLEPLVNSPQVLDLARDARAWNVIETMLEQMMAEFSWPQFGRSFMCDWLTRVVLMTACRHLQQSQPTAEISDQKKDLFRQFRELVEQHYRDHWPVSRYAEALSLSPPRLNRLCQSFADKGAAEMAQDRVALEAQRHLIYTSATVDMIAFELGFQDPAYFSRFFKRRMGLAPGQFRKKKLAEPFPH